MKKIFAYILIFMALSLSVSAVTLRNDVEVNNPEPISVTGGLFAFAVGNEIEVKYKVSDSNTPNSASSFRTFVYNTCNNVNGRVVNAIYESSNILSGLSCIYDPDKQVTTTMKATNDFKGIGESCNSYLDCGSACDSFSDSYSPRCIDGGQGNVCFCGQNTGIYSTVCAKDSDCPSDESCVSGICTLTKQNAANSGNPIESLTEQEINKIIKPGKCEDGTPKFECSTDAGYCNSELKLVPNNLLCGDVDCKEGDKTSSACPVGNDKLEFVCRDGKWARVSSLCKTNIGGLGAGLGFGIGALTISGVIIASILVLIGVMLFRKK